jgi:hypothetical protein
VFLLICSLRKKKRTTNRLVSNWNRGSQHKLEPQEHTASGSGASWKNKEGSAI